MAQVGIKGPFEIPYQEGYWDPVPHSLTIVGAGPVVYSGIYRLIGSVCFYILLVSCPAGTTSASTAGTTWFDGLPIRLHHSNFSCHAGDTQTLLAFAGSGMNEDDGVTGCIDTPTWPATRFVRVSGWYLTSL